MMIQNQEQGGVPGGAPANKKKFPWMIALGGCGCLTVLLLIVAGVIGYFAVGQAKSRFSELSEGYDITATSDGDEVSSGSKKSSKSDSGSKSSRKDSKNADSKTNALEPAKIRAYLDKPLTKADIDAFHKSADAWKKNKTFVEYEKNIEEMTVLEKKKEKSTVEQMRLVRNVSKMATWLPKLTTEFDEHLKKHGGAEEHFSRVLRISGVIAATDKMAKQHKIEDKNSDEAIKMVLKEQPEIAAEYQEGVKEAKAAAARGEEATMEAYVAISSGGPGALAMSRMPAASFKTWQSLSPAARKKAEDDMQTSLGVTSFIGIGLHPVLLFQTAFAAEFEEISGKK